MKIALLTHTFFPTVGGAEVVVHELSRQFNQLGHEAVVVAPWGVREVREELDYRTIALPPKAIMAGARVPGCDALLGAWLRRMQRRERFDVWHLHSLWPAAWAVRGVLRSLRIPSVATAHGGDIQICEEGDYGLRRFPEFERKIREVLPQITRLHAINAAMGEDMVEGGARPEQIVVIPNGIDLARFRETDCDVAAVRRRLDWPDGTAIILTVGRNHPKKGYIVIPDVVAHLRELTDGFLWVVVGRGTENVEARARELGVDDLIRFVPEIRGAAGESHSRFELPPAEIIRLYKAADVFAFPTLVEATPLVVLEAMAARTAIATTNADGPRHTLVDGVTGLLSDVGDAAGMAANLARLIDDPGLRRELEDNADRAVDQHDWRLVAERFLELFDEAIAAVGRSLGP